MQIAEDGTFHKNDRDDPRQCGWLCDKLCSWGDRDDDDDRDDGDDGDGDELKIINKYIYDDGRGDDDEENYWAIFRWPQKSSWSGYFGFLKGEAVSSIITIIPSMMASSYS